LKPVKRKSDTIAIENTMKIKRIFLLENLFGFKAM
jgi:hypothetical protein